MSFVLVSLTFIDSPGLFVHGDDGLRGRIFRSHSPGSFSDRMILFCDELDYFALGFASDDLVLGPEVVVGVGRVGLREFAARHLGFFHSNF